MIELTHKTRAPGYNAMDLSGILPERLSGLSADQIGTMSILVDETPQPLGDFWEIQPDSSDQLLLTGNCSRCDAIAAGLTSGAMTIAGDVGERLAWGMRGGQVTVEGSAGRFAASSLQGGTVHIRGDVGEFAAGAPPGASRGMRGGMLIIDGDSDRWLAARMRRGTVIARGRVQSGCAARMLAGSLILFGPITPPLGFGMKRGSILHLNGLECDVAAALVGFTVAESCELSFLPLLLDRLQPFLNGNSTPRLDNPRRVWRALGDRAVGGLGECLWFPAKGKAGPSRFE